MKIIFFGTPQFAANVLSYLLQHKLNVVAVVTKPDRPLGRSGTPVATPVKVIAELNHPPLPVFQPELVSLPSFAETLEQFQADLFVVVAYGEILKQHLLDLPKVACINIHASLLPKYRGAAPIQRCLIEGETESGVTIMHMVKKMDAGDMIKKGVVPIGPNTTYGELEQQLCRVGSDLILESIRDFEAGTAQRTPQDHTTATLAPKLELEDCEIDWKLPAQQIHNLVRGVNPHPGAWCFVEVKGQKKRLKVIATRVAETDTYDDKPGQIQSPKNALIVKCGIGSLAIIELQLEGKKAMPAEELMRGIAQGSLIFFSF
ncbi:MAG: methionyl-tRNA formyltransferase [Parachlamydiaceae bacterium]|nr:methionyl-tRNA formyltransferase [Parachlamydiaceae bacterium]